MASSDEIGFIREMTVTKSQSYTSNYDDSQSQSGSGIFKMSEIR